MTRNDDDIMAGARWIGAPPAVRDAGAPLMRCGFDLASDVARATWRLCGLGYHEPWCNGRRVSDHVLDPAQTDYDQRCLYVTHDVTGLLQPGGNAIGVVLGNGWYCQDRVWAEGGLSYGSPRLIAALHIAFADGSEQVVTTDEHWRCAAGPITDHNVYAGEHYDARLERPGWNAPGCDDSAWHGVEVVAAPGGRLEPQRMPPIRRTERLRPRGIRQLGEGAFLVDMGQNFAGWAEIRVRGERGKTVRLRFAETIDDAGDLDTASTGVFATGVEQVDRYTCRGDGVEVWEPRFTYHGYRYVEVTGWPGELAADDIAGVVVHTDLKPAGAFACSDARLNQLHTMALWTHRSNIHGLPEDCPARERCGWLGDANVVAEMSLWNCDGAAFWRKYLDDIETTRRRHDGLPADIAPGLRTGGVPANPDWAAAFIMLPWYVYRHTADAGVLTRHYDGVRQLIEHFGDRADGWILEGGYGDWFDPGGDAIVSSTEPTLTTTLWFCRCAEVMSRAASITGRADDAARYAEWATLIGAALVERFYNAEQCTFGSQTADAMALRLGVAPPADRQAVADAIARDITARDDHLNVGIMGVRFVFEALTRHGHGELALRVLRQDSYPSFGDLIARGATTLWEYWGEPQIDGTHGPRSLSHPMFAGYDNWFYNTLAGIEIDDDRPGFEHVFITPHPIAGLDWVEAHHDTRFGRLAVGWRRDGDELRWRIDIPPGSSATFTPPDGGEAQTLTPGRHEGACAAN